MSKEKTTERKAGDAILQRPETVTAGGRTYRIAPPSTATLILVSETVSELPDVKIDKENFFMESLAKAEHFRAIGEIAATLVLGAKAIREDEGGAGPLRRRLFRRRTKRERLARELMEDLTPAELNRLVAAILQGMEIGDFFAITTFLSEINLLKPTRKVETGATASGQ